MCSPIIWQKVFAWFAVAICISISARGATVFAKNSPRVFTILALFSLNWALLIPYYSQPEPPELLASFAGFLLVYIGVLLRREAKDSLTVNSEKPDESVEEKLKNVGKTESLVGRGDRIALWLLGLLIAPSLISLPFVYQVESLNSKYTEPIIGSVVTIIGYYSIWSAIRIYSSRKNLQWILFGVLAIYTVIEISFTVLLIIKFYNGTISEVTDPTKFWCNSPIYPMNEKFLILFGLLKLVFVPLFIYLVLHESVSDEDRNLSLADKVFKLFGIL